MPPRARGSGDLRRAGRAGAPHRRKRPREDAAAAGRRHREPHPQTPQRSAGLPHGRAVRAGAASARSGTSSTTPTGPRTTATSSSSSSAATRAAEPSLDCPELDAEHLIVDGVLADRTPRATRVRDAAAGLPRSPVADGIDLARYTSAESAADLADLRAALGYDAWNLYGVSYGARLAMTVMRDHPEGLRSVILDGAYPPERQPLRVAAGGLPHRARRACSRQCAADADCHERIPTSSRPVGPARRCGRHADLRRVKSPADGSAVQARHPRHRCHRRPVRRAVRRRASCGSCRSSSTSSRAGTPSAAPARAAQRRLPPTTSRRVSISPSMRRGGAVQRRRASSAEALAADPLLRALRAARGPSVRTAPTWAVPALVGGREPGGRERHPDPDHERRVRPGHPARVRARRRRRSSPRATCTCSPRWATDRSGRTGSTTARHPSPQQFLRDPAAEPDSSCIAAMAAHRLPHHRRHLPDDRDLPLQQRCRPGPQSGADRHRRAHAGDPDRHARVRAGLRHRRG